MSKDNFTSKLSPWFGIMDYGDTYLVDRVIVHQGGVLGQLLPEHGSYIAREIFPIVTYCYVFIDEPCFSERWFNSFSNTKKVTA